MITMALLLAAQVAAAPAPTKRPNILFAIADDVSWPHFGAYGTKWVTTPNFDRVAKDGILFHNAFTSNPKCSPSRASILTGRYSWQLEEATNHFGIFPSKFKVYPDLLEAAGYDVAFTGKPWSPGDFKAGGWKRNPAGAEYNQVKLKPPRPGISAVDYAANFKDFLAKRKPGAPFAFWYGGHEAHRGYNEGSGIRAGKKANGVTVPAYLPDDPIVRSDLLDYALEIEWFDSHLGQMLAALELAGELDNTIVVVTGDNGMPFPRVKGQIYEQDVHLPLAIRWGSVVKRHRSVDDFINFADFAPTFLEAAGVTPLREMSGKSFLNVLTSTKSGQVDPKRDRTFTGKERHDIGRPQDVGYPARAIRTHEFLFVHNFEPDRWPAGNPETGYTNIDDSPTKSLILKQKDNGQDKYWNLAMGKRPADELYRIKTDPACLKNLAADPKHAKVKADLWAELKKTLLEHEDPRILGKGEVFDRYKYTGTRGHGWDEVMTRTNGKGIGIGDPKVKGKDKDTKPE